MSASSRSNTGAPSPTGTPVATTSTMPPADEPALRTPSRYSAQRSAAAASGAKNGLRCVSSQSQRPRSTPCGPICTSAPRTSTPAPNTLPGDGPGGDAHRGLAGAGAAAAAIVADAVLGLVGEVGVARAEQLLDPAVVLGARVLVLDEQADGRAGGQPLEDAGQDPHPVGFAPLGGVPALPRAAAVELALEVGLAQCQPRRDPVDHAADRRPVAFAEGRDPEQRAEGVAGHAVALRGYFGGVKPSSISRIAGAWSGAIMPTTW